MRQKVFDNVSVLFFLWKCLFEWIFLFEWCLIVCHIRCHGVLPQFDPEMRQNGSKIHSNSQQNPYSAGGRHDPTLPHPGPKTVEVDPPDGHNMA